MDVLWPLVGCRSADPLLGGYGWLEWNGDTFHCGVDLNAGAGGQADCGAPVVAPVDMLIVQAIHGIQNGFGNHVWATTDGGVYLHFCHLETIGITDGRVGKGSVFATCGRTNGWPNGWPYCHLHFEVLRGRPANWEFWPKGYSRERVDALYLDPIAWLEAQEAASLPQEDEMTESQRAILDLAAALNMDRDGLEATVNKVGRAAEIGRAIRDARTLSVKTRKALGQELAAMA